MEQALYKVYDLKEDGEVGDVIDITSDYNKWKKKADNYEVIICVLNLK